MKLSFLFRTAFPILLGICLLGYIIVRAIMLPVTHDEANTILTYSTMSIHDIVTYAVPIPNNHILNTLLIKFFDYVFGMHALPARLPNILGFILYFSIVFLFSRKVSKDPFVTFFGICIMTCNPYLLEFFSLARGYGLSISFMMASMYFAYLFLGTYKQRDLVWSVLFGAIAVYTNFTSINFFVALAGLLAWVSGERYFQQKSIKAKSSRVLVQQLLIIISVTLLLTAISYLPISKMVATKQFIFWGQNGFYSDTILPLLHALQYNVDYGGITETGFSYLILAFFAVIFLCNLRIWLKNRGRISASPQVFFFLVFTGTVVVNISQFHMIHTPYLITRTALFFYPLLAINFIFFAEYIYNRFHSSRIYFSLLLSILFLSHFLRAANFNSSFEWWYDADTFTIFKYLEKENADNPHVISLNTHWLFFPSFDFHVITENKDWIKLAPFHREAWPDSSYEYYYTVSEEKNELDSTYTTVLSLGWDSRFLMKRKK